MVAIDTNIVIRFIVNDDPDQSARARNLIATEDVWLSRTVLLECEWVLRRGLGLGRDFALDRLRAFSGLRGVVLEELDHVIQAFELAAAGMDFADALHLTATEAGQRFATFDLDLIRLARRSGVAKAFSP